MEDAKTRIILTGFMGVGKSTVARHVSNILRTDYYDLDDLIEENEKKRIAEILRSNGEETFRRIETENLKRLLKINSQIIALGGGAWTIKKNRELINEYEYTSVWLDSTFEHCWRNIRFSKRERPLAQDKVAAKNLFTERQSFYCLADWHFVIKPGFNSYDIAYQISREIFA